MQIRADGFRLPPRLTTSGIIFLCRPHQHGYPALEILLHGQFALLVGGEFSSHSIGAAR